MPNPNTAQGFLNRTNAAVYFLKYPELNVTPSFVGKAGISLRFTSKATTIIPTMSGRVLSPEPYLEATLTLDLIRSQSLAGLWQNQMEQDSKLGNLTVYPDIDTSTPGIGVYELINCAMDDPPDLPFAGTDASYRITVSGTYNINNSLWTG